MDTYDSEIIDETLNSEKFTQSIDEAVPLQVKIMTDIKTSMSELCDEFCNMMIKSEPEISVLMKIKRKDRTPEEQEKLKNFIKASKRKFRTTMKLIHPKEGTDPIGSMIQKLVDITKFISYIDKGNLQERFKEVGISYDFESLEDENPFFANEDTKTLIKDIFNRGDDVYNTLTKTNDIIDNDIYGDLDDNIVYSKDNPEGIKKNQFRKLLTTKAKSMILDSDKYTEYKQSLIKKETANIISQKTVVENLKLN